MKVKELIEALQKLDQDDLIVITVVADEIESDCGYYEPDVRGRDGFYKVSEIGIGELISG